MALERIGKIGVNNFKCSVLTQLSHYLVSTYTYITGTDVRIICESLGTDITPIILANPTGYVLVTFKDGSKIYYDNVGIQVNQYGDVSLTSCSFALRYRDSLGNIKNCANIQYGLKATRGSSTVFYPHYLCVGLDEEIKKGYFLLACHDYYGYTTSFEGGLKIIPITDIYGGNDFLYSMLTGNGIIYDPDPWSVGGYADIGGGDGELDLHSDPIALPALPTSISELGFVQMFCPTLTDIKNLSEYMWHGDFLDNFLKLFNDPMDIIISLSMVPFPITPTGSRYVTAGNVITTVQMPYTSQQYVEIDCGSLDVKHFYNAYIDYEPYTTCEIFLPYIGYQKLSMDEIMGTTIHVKYRVDLMTGLCAAYILCNNILLYSFTGSCSTSIPVNGQSFASIAQSAINIATSTVLSAKPTKNASAISNAEKGGAGSLASNVLSMKPDVQRSGSVISNIGMLGAQKPHLIFSVLRSCLPKGQNKYLGYPSFMSTPLSSLSGYTVVEDMRLENMSCTEAEKNEIIEILKGGAIL